MIEVVWRLAPAGRAVALETILPQDTAVDIFVAGGAYRFESDEAAIALLARRELRCLGDLVLRLVAILTLDGGVLVGEGPPGSAVVELLDTAIREVDQGLFETLVLGVTGGAVTGFLLPVKAAAAGFEPGDLRVAGETFVGHGRATVLMALEAFERTFEALMVMGERPRADLDPLRPADRDQSQKEGDE